MDNALKKKLITVGIAIALAAGAWYTWQKYKGGKDDGALLHGNGRIEATEVDVATKLAGRVDNILVSEGAFVKAGQVLATMQVQTLNAQLREAKAQLARATIAIDTAHGHSKGVLEAVAALRRRFPSIPILAGNVVTRQAVRDLAGEQVTQRILLKRVGSADDVAHAVWFLASRFADYITGEVLHVDGGFKME